jgi:hypothetical protein
MEIKEISNIVPTLIQLEEFNEAPGPNCMSFNFDIERLVCSIEAVGLINMPFVTRNREGRLDIVTGYRRIIALKAMKYASVYCRDLSGSEFSEYEMFLINLYDNIAIRRFNDVEKGMILKGLMMNISKEDVERDFIHILDIKNPREIDMLMEISEFNETEKRYIAKGDISINAIRLVRGLDNRSRSVILKCISELGLNFNQQLQYIDYISDISIKEGKSIADIMDEYQFLSYLKEKDINTPQKGRAILNLLRTRRFPFLTKNEKEFNKKIKRLGFPDGIRIKHPPFFEGQDYRLEIVFKDGIELKQKVCALARIEELNNIKDPWREDS